MKTTCPTCNTSVTAPDHEISESDGRIACSHCRTEFTVTGPGAAVKGTQEITASLLGLDELDTFTHKVPDVFIGLKNHDPVHIHRQIVSSVLPYMSTILQEQLISFLAAMSGPRSVNLAPQLAEIVLLTQDQLLSHVVTTASARENITISVTDDANGLDAVIEQVSDNGDRPILLIDIPHNNDGMQTLAFVRNKVSSFPNSSIFLTVCPHTWHVIGTGILETGADLILPRPCIVCHENLYVSQLMTFLSGSGFLNVTPSLFQSLRNSRVKKPCSV